MATERKKWGRTRFNYPTETTVNDIHKTTPKATSDVSPVTAFLGAALYLKYHPTEVSRVASFMSKTTSFATGAPLEY
jgi:hypothetical protein